MIILLKAVCGILLAILVGVFAALGYVAASPCGWGTAIELGNHFAVTQADDTDLRYDPDGKKECYWSRKSVQVVPFGVTACAHDGRWIVAECEDLDKSSYYIIDKRCEFSSSREEYVEELRRQTIGPLDTLQFLREKQLRGITLELRPVENARSYSRRKRMTKQQGQQKGSYAREEKVDEGTGL